MRRILRKPNIQPNGVNATLVELYMAMEASPTKRGYIHLNSIRLFLTGTPRATVCQIFCRSDRMVR